MKDALKQLVEALEAAQEHLGFTGYGDSYERECARDARLEERIENALAAGRKVLEEK